MKIIHGLLLICVCALLSLGCNSSESADDKSPLMGTEWLLFELDGEMFVPASGKNVTLRLDSEKKGVNGKAPCNIYGGSYTKKSNKLSFSELYSTEMACDELDKETIFIKQMQKAYAYQISADKLYLFDSTGMVILRFKAR